MNCPRCGAEALRRPGRGRPSLWCSQDCRRAASLERATAAGRCGWSRSCAESAGDCVGDEVFLDWPGHGAGVGNGNALTRSIAYDPLVRLSSQVLTQVAPKTGDFTTISDERTVYNTLSQPVSVVNMLGGQGQCFDYTGYGELSAAWTQYATSATPTCVNKGPTDASWVVDNANAGAPYYQSWTFDAATGNTASRTEGNKAAVNNPAVSTFGYGVAGHVNAVKTLTTTGGTSPGTTTYDYTAAGSRNTGTGNATNQVVQWNVLNQPTAVTEGAVTTTNVYGPDGARMVRANPSTVAVFVGDTQFTYDTTSTTTTAYRQYGLAGVLVGYRDTSVDTNLRWSAADGQGSGVLQADPATLSRSGGFTRASYTPYGTQRLIGTGTWQSDYKWLNKPLDPSTGLVQTGARLCMAPRWHCQMAGASRTDHS